MHAQTCTQHTHTHTQAQQLADELVVPADSASPSAASGGAHSVSTSGGASPQQQERQEELATSFAQQPASDSKGGASEGAEGTSRRSSSSDDSQWEAPAGKTYGPGAPPGAEHHTPHGFAFGNPLYDTPASLSATPSRTTPEQSMELESLPLVAAAAVAAVGFTPVHAGAELRSWREASTSPSPSMGDGLIQQQPTTPSSVSGRGTRDEVVSGTVESGPLSADSELPTGSLLPLATMLAEQVVSQQGAAEPGAAGIQAAQGAARALDALVEAKFRQVMPPSRIPTLPASSPASSLRRTPQTNVGAHAEEADTPLGMQALRQGAVGAGGAASTTEASIKSPAVAPEGKEGEGAAPSEDAALDTGGGEEEGLQGVLDIVEVVVGQVQAALPTSTSTSFSAAAHANTTPMPAGRPARTPGAVWGTASGAKSPPSSGRLSRLIKQLQEVAGVNSAAVGTDSREHGLLQERSAVLASALTEIQAALTQQANSNSLPRAEAVGLEEGRLTAEEVAELRLQRGVLDAIQHCDEVSEAASALRMARPPSESPEEGREVGDSSSAMQHPGFSPMLHRALFGSDDEGEGSEGGGAEGAQGVVLEVRSGTLGSRAEPLFVEPVVAVGGDEDDGNSSEGAGGEGLEDFFQEARQETEGVGGGDSWASTQQGQEQRKREGGDEDSSNDSVRGSTLVDAEQGGENVVGDASTYDGGEGKGEGGEETAEGDAPTLDVGAAATTSTLSSLDLLFRLPSSSMSGASDLLTPHLTADLSALAASLPTEAAAATTPNRTSTAGAAGSLGGAGEPPSADAAAGNSAAVAAGNAATRALLPEVQQHMASLNEGVGEGEGVPLPPMMVGGGAPLLPQDLSTSAADLSGDLIDFSTVPAAPAAPDATRPRLPTDVLFEQNFFAAHHSAGGASEQEEQQQQGVPAALMETAATSLTLGLPSASATQQLGLLDASQEPDFSGLASPPSLQAEETFQDSGVCVHCARAYVHMYRTAGRSGG